MSFVAIIKYKCN